MSDTEEGPLSLDQEMDELLGIERDDSKADLVRELADVSAKASKYENRKKEIKRELLNHLDSLGMTAATLGGRKIYKSTTVYYGIDPSMLPAAKAWLERVAPEMNVPASQKINKAVEAFQNENPGEPLPDFITSSETVSLGNRKA